MRVKGGMGKRGLRLTCRGLMSATFMTSCKSHTMSSIRIVGCKRTLLRRVNNSHTSAAKQAPL